jgi:hypothetical protein
VNLGDSFSRARRSTGLTDVNGDPAQMPTDARYVPKASRQNATPAASPEQCRERMD